MKTTLLLPYPLTTVLSETVSPSLEEEQPEASGGEPIARPNEITEEISKEELDFYRTYYNE
jgi:hypothetical protein